MPSLFLCTFPTATLGLPGWVSRAKPEQASKQAHDFPCPRGLAFGSKYK